MPARYSSALPKNLQKAYSTKQTAFESWNMPETMPQSILRLKVSTPFGQMSEMHKGEFSIRDLFEQPYRMREFHISDSNNCLVFVGESMIGDKRVSSASEAK
jgi:hypothetical protein